MENGEVPVSEVDLVYTNNGFEFRMPDRSGYTATNKFIPCKARRLTKYTLGWDCWTYKGREEEAFPALLNKAREDLDELINDFDKFTGNELVKQNYLARWKKDE